MNSMIQDGLKTKKNSLISQNFYDKISSNYKLQTNKQGNNRNAGCLNRKMKAELIRNESI